MEGLAGYSLGMILLILAGLAVLAFVGFLVAMRLRRWARDPHADAEIPFTLEDLRRLHREGRLTDEEFRRAHDSMLARRPNAEEIARYRLRK
jgi:uncharacterized membrane protein